MGKQNILIEEILNIIDGQTRNSLLISKIILRKRKRLAALFAQKKVPRTIPKNKKYLETINGMPNDVFYSHIRMQISTFEKLHCMLEPLWSKLSTGRPRDSLTKRLYMTIWKLSNQSSFREVSDRFNIGMGACYRGFIQCIQIISAQKQIIAFLTTELTQKRAMEAFESCRTHPFPYVLGCIDGTHIKILQLSKDGISYYNRKGTHSVIVQAVADSNMRSLDVFIGYPGRWHDAAMWSASPLKRAIVNNLISFPPECHLLGDAAYPLETYLMVSYKDNGFLSEAQTTYNNILSSTRVCVEQAFGVLKKKFRILNFLEVHDIKLAKNIIMSCFALHNYVYILEHEGTPDGVIIENVPSTEINTLPADGNQRSEARAKKERLANLLSA